MTDSCVKLIDILYNKNNRLKTGPDTTCHIIKHLNNKKMTLLEQVQQRTQQNVVKSSTKKNICDSIHEILYEGKKELRRVEVIGLITLERLKEVYPKLKDTDELTDEQIKKLDSINITVKNGLDTAVCNGSTPSSYCSNPNYEKFKLIKTGDKLKIVDKK